MIACVECPDLLPGLELTPSTLSEFQLAYMREKITAVDAIDDAQQSVQVVAPSEVGAEAEETMPVDKVLAERSLVLRQLDNCAQPHADLLDSPAQQRRWATGSLLRCLHLVHFLCRAASFVPAAEPLSPRAHERLAHYTRTRR